MKRSENEKELISDFFSNFLFDVLVAELLSVVSIAVKLTESFVFFLFVAKHIKEFAT